MDWGLFLVSIVVAGLFLIGLIGIFLPALPGVALIFAGTLLFAIVDGFHRITGGTLAVFAALTVLSVALDFAAGIVGAKRYLAGRWGVAGAVIGMLVGLFFGLPGMVLGPLVGAVAFELLAGREPRAALRAGWGTFVGFLGGGVLKLAIGVGIIGTFIYKVLAY
jgi:uncharacterized protein YqgC (DUF456 family)